MVFEGASAHGRVLVCPRRAQGALLPPHAHTCPPWQASRILDSPGCLSLPLLPLKPLKPLKPLLPWMPWMLARWSTRATSATCGSITGPATTSPRWTSRAVARRPQRPAVRPAAGGETVNFDGTPSPSLLKRLRNVEGGAAE